MAQEPTVIREFGGWTDSYFRVERRYNGWDWREESLWESKAAAYYAAEKLTTVTGDRTRVVR